MLEAMLNYERDFFFLINHTRAAFLDSFMYLVSNTLIWIPLFVYLIVILVSKAGWKKCLPVLIAIAFVFLACDQFSSSVCKPLFARPRPTHHPNFMDQVQTVYGYRGGLYGFISGHATNAFGFATISMLLFKDKLYAGVIFAFAFIIAYSRVYLGVHFISDIVAGGIAGFVIGFITYQAYRAYCVKFQPDSSGAIAIPTKQLIIFSMIIASYLFGLLIFSILRHIYMIS